MCHMGDTRGFGSLHVFLGALADAKAGSGRIVLEHPYLRITRAEIDTYILHLGGRAFGIEIKYARENPGGTNPRPQKAGA